MGVSVSGVLTLLALLLVGPLVLSLQSLWRRFQSPNADAEAENEKSSEGDEAREETKFVDYVMSLIGYAIGIGNVWRFPYLVGKNGGGAFVFAYVFMLFLVSFPLFFAELALGHQTRKSTIDALKAVHSRWEGLGRAQGLLVTVTSTYFNILIAYALVYVGGCVLDPLPWLGAPGRAEAFWKEDVLNAYPDGIAGNGLGGLEWKLVVALFVIQAMNFGAIAFGRDILAKVTWITVVGPVILLVILLYQSVQLEGAAEGVAFYLWRFEWKQLLNIRIWATACSQILFSLSPGFGTAITMSSTTAANTDVYKTAWIVSMCNSGFSIMGGFAVFSILGHVAVETGQEVAAVATKSGPGLAFVAIAEGMKTFGPATNVMSVLFFTMLVALGLDSSFAWIETIVIIVQDWARERGHQVGKLKLTAATCAGLFVVGLIYCTRGGNAVLDVVDHFVGSMFLLFGCALEAIALRFGFDFTRILQGIKTATATPELPGGRHVHFPGLWKFVMDWTMPVGPAFLVGYLFIADLMEPYEGYPAWLLAVGWSGFALCVILALSTLSRRGEHSLESPKVVEMIGSSASSSGAESSEQGSTCSAQQSSSAGSQDDINRV